MWRMICIVALVVACWALSACSSNDGGSSTCEDSSCSDTGGDLLDDVSDGASDGITDEDATGGPGDVSDGDGGHPTDDVSDGIPTDGDVSDADVPADTGEAGDSDSGEGDTGEGDGDTDSGDMDGGGGTDEEWEYTPGALAGYLTCSDDVDCPVGLGRCVRSVTFNRPDREGVSEVTVSALSGGAVSGVCTLTCTADAGSCTQLVSRDVRGRDVPWTCQLVAQGASPYTVDFEAPEGALDLEEMALGRPFAALCRPPLELSARRGRSFCAPCEESAECGDGLCFDPLDEAESTGEHGLCLTACDAENACPFGFSCEEIEGDEEGTWCRPLLDTCTACLDRDRNGYGTGLCASDDAATPYDCNDYEALAYFDPSDPDHPFPALCSGADFNCNGLPDDVEQIGNTEWRVPLDPDAPEEGVGVAHCTGCGEVCGGALPNARWRCREDAESESGFACVVQCDAAGDGIGPFANCDGQAGTGCETDFTAEGQADTDLRAGWSPGDEVPETALWYADCDGDGFGDPEKPLLVCPGLEVDPAEEPLPCDDPAEGAVWVRNNLDCDDGDAERFPGNTEVCNGKDSNCDGTVDTPALLTGMGDDCSLGLPGACDAGVRVCLSGEPICERRSGTPLPSGELCTGYDPACDPDEDRSLSQLQALLGQACNTDQTLGECVNRWTCSTSGIACTVDVGPAADRPDLELRDTSCDGIDGDVNRAIFVRAGAPDGGNGTRQSPYNNIATAYAAAVSQNRDVYVARGTYTLTSTLELQNGVSIFGGYSPSDWSSRSAQSGGTVLRFESSVQNGWRIGLRGRDLTTRTELQALTVDVRRPSTPGAGVIGVECMQCPGLELRAVQVMTEGGATGAAGTDNSDAAPVNGLAGNSGSGSTGAARRSAPDCGGALQQRGGSGGNGSDGSTALSGSSTAAGNGASGMWEVSYPGERASGGPGGTGTLAATGNNGGHGQGGQEARPANGGENTLQLSEGLPRSRSGWSGRPGLGGGGGGGGSGSTALLNASPVELRSSGGGGGGTGGCGGVGGGAGAGGGHSFGLALRDSGQVTLQQVTITAGPGGAGGAGGQGSPGGAGGAGTVGVTRTASGVTLVGGRGGSGGGGAGGSGGGGGAGGWSFAIFRDADSGYQDAGGVSLTGGSPGMGGQGGQGGQGGTTQDERSPEISRAVAGVAGLQGAEGRSGDINGTSASDPTRWP